jgi:LysR family hydrogen peroxide-inducible transcriptional activator
VALACHFGRAAEASFVSQPTLSVAIKKLEDELGVALFERNAGEVVPTLIGERIVEQAQRVLERAAAVKEIAKSGPDPLKGPLKLGVIYTIAPYLLPNSCATWSGARRKCRCCCRCKDRTNVTAA